MMQINIDLLKNSRSVCISISNKFDGKHSNRGFQVNTNLHFLEQICRIRNTILLVVCMCFLTIYTDIAIQSHISTAVFLDFSTFSPAFCISETFSCFVLFHRNTGKVHSKFTLYLLSADCLFQRWKHVFVLKPFYFYFLIDLLLLNFFCIFKENQLELKMGRWIAIWPVL